MDDRLRQALWHIADAKVTRARMGDPDLSDEEFRENAKSVDRSLAEARTLAQQAKETA